MESRSGEGWHQLRDFSHGGLIKTSRTHSNSRDPEGGFACPSLAPLPCTNKFLLDAHRWGFGGGESSRNDENNRSRDLDRLRSFRLLRTIDSFRWGFDGAQSGDAKLTTGCRYLEGCRCGV